MRVLSAIIFLTISLTANAKVFTAGMKQPVELPNGRNGSTSIAVYKTVNSVVFSLVDSSAVVVFTTSDLYLKGCSASGISTRCPLGETTVGNQQIVIVNNTTKTTVFSEIFKYGLSSGVAFPPSTVFTDKVSVSSNANITSTLHAVSNVLPAGSYTAHLQLRNDFNPMTVHPKRISAIVFE